MRERVKTCPNLIGKVYSSRSILIVLICTLVFAWLFSSWPQVWHNPSIPPQAKLAHAATSVDGTASTTGGKGSSFTFSHTVGSGNDRLLIVGISLLDVDSAKDVSSVSYNGNSLTEVENFAGSDIRVQIFRMAAPPVGTADVVVNISNGQDNTAAIGAIAFTGVDQTTPIDTGTIATGSGEKDAPALNVTSESGDLVMDVLGTDKILPDVGAGQTEQWNEEHASGKESGASTEAGAGSVTMSWSSASGKFTQVGFNINASDTTAPTVSTLSPADDATGVAVDTNLVITFDEDVVASTTGNITIKKTSDDSTVETIAADDAKVTIVDETATINPAATLDDFTEYYVLIDAGAFEDASGNDYAGISSTTAWSFTTADTTAPSDPGSPEATISDNLNLQDWSWTASTDDGSGVKHYLWRVEDGPNGTVTSPEVTTDLTEGIQKFFVKAVDNAGNESAENSSLLAVMESSLSEIEVDCSFPLTQVVIDDDVPDPKLDLSPISILSGEVIEATTNCEIRSKTIFPSGAVTTTIPNGTTIKGLSTFWDKKMIAPIATTPDTALLPANSEVELAIKIGSDNTSLETTKGVRILKEGQAGKKVGHISNNEFSEITSICADDSQATGDALAANTSCKIDSGSDLVIWTKHFSEFLTYDLTTSSITTSSTDRSTPSCGDQAPGAKAPWLYGAIPQDGSSILLYFTPSDNPVNKYVLKYGTKPGDYPYGVQDMGVNSRGQMTFLVKSLSPNTAYYFRVRGRNGCATGPWSNEISAKTKGLISFNQLEIAQSELETKPTTAGSCQTYTVKSGDNLWLIAKNLLGDATKYKEIIGQNKDKYSSLENSNNLKVGWKLKVNCEEHVITEETQKQGSYDVKVKVVDTAKKPVEGAKVTIHSTVQEATTNKDGIAEFKNVEAGEHRILIAYKNFEGEQSVNLTGDVKEIDLNVTVQQKAVVLSPLVYGIIGIMALVIITLSVLLIKAKRKRKL